MVSHLPVDTPAFFHRGPSPAARLVFFGLVSIVLLFLDARYRYLEQVRQVVAVVLHPVQRAAALPGAVLAGIMSKIDESAQVASAAKPEDAHSCVQA